MTTAKKKIRAHLDGMQTREDWTKEGPIDKQVVSECAVEGIARGEHAIDEGRVATHVMAKKRLARWLT